MNASSEPRGQKEIRFTRNAQAAHFFLLSLGCLCPGLTLCLLSLNVWSVSTGPVLENGWYALVPAPFVILFALAGVHLAKHAYIIFSPVGIELFPFFFPSKHMQVLYWSEVAGIDLAPDERLLEITLAGEPESKVFVTAAPLSRHSRSLLVKTVAGIRSRRARGAAPLDSASDPPPANTYETP